jgi:hypothetical protein
MSPVDMVHQLGVYIHSSPLRMDEFERIRAAKNPETPKGLLPLKDVVTRWNSKEAAIQRILRLRASVEVFTARETNPKCRRFTRETFAALDIVHPSLKIFLQLTQVYSEVGAHSYRIIPDLINAIDQLRELHSHPSVSAARYESSEAAIKKLNKYLKRFLNNQWVCAAFALDPTVREEGLQALRVDTYNMPKQYKKTMAFIRDRTKDYVNKSNRRLGPQENDVQMLKPKPKRVNKFASTRFQAGHQEISHNVDDPWECYNSDLKRFETVENESVLGYWKRMSQHRDMVPLCHFARDVLGLASSSASVERLFSHAGHVLGKKRGSLSARLLSKQLMLRMWDLQGIFSMDDIEARG